MNDVSKIRTVDASAKPMRYLLDYDDDEGDAEWDDDDPDWAAAVPEGRFTNSGFGSLEWWSRR